VGHITWQGVEGVIGLMAETLDLKRKEENQSRYWRQYHISE